MDNGGFVKTTNAMVALAQDDPAGVADTFS